MTHQRQRHHGERLLGGFLVFIALIFLGFAPPATAAPVVDKPSTCPADCGFGPSLIDAAAQADAPVLSLGFMRFGEIGAGYVRAVSEVAHRLDASITPIPARQRSGY